MSPALAVFALYEVPMIRLDSEGGLLMSRKGTSEGSEVIDISTDKNDW